VLARVIERLREAEPDAIGILAHGSYATGRARPESDLDLAVLLP
jgi:predicted nucleotidyltransferase